jgi:hypothetical protein
VVNPEVAESQLERWTPRELRERITSPSARLAESTSDWTRLAFTGASRRSLVLPLLVAALVMIAAEIMLARGGAVRGNMDPSVVMSSRA